MESETENTASMNYYKPALMLSDRPLLSECNEQQNPHNIIYALAGHQYVVVDLEKVSKVFESQQVHQARIGSLRYKDNLLMTGGYDHKVKLFDFRNQSLIHTFQRVPGQFNAVDKTEHILAGASSSNITFWDLRKMRQRSQFRESFNNEITYLRFDDTKSASFAACSLDGMVSWFDLAQPNEEDAFVWCHKIMESPQSISSMGEEFLVQTVDHHLYKISQSDFIGKISPNNIANPKHILHSSLKQHCYEYFTWSPSQEVIEHWTGRFRDPTNEENCLGYINHVNDVEILNIDKHSRCAIWADEKGCIFINEFGSHRADLTKTQEPQSESELTDIKGNTLKPKCTQKATEQQVQTDMCNKINKNGYLLEKPRSFLKANANRKHRPF